MQLIEKISANPYWVEFNKKYKIGAISPSSYPRLSLEQLTKIQHISIDLNQDLFSKSAHPFHANRDEQRLLMLNNKLYSQDPNMIIWCINGGYGSAKLIDKLRHQIKPKTPKLFIGYSDVTALLLFLNQEWKWPVIHGACLGEMFEDKDPNNFFNIIDVILRKKNFYPTDLKALNEKGSYTLKNKDYFCKNKWIGGNLTVIQTGINTCWQIKTKDKIVFLEDINEPGYKIDRILHHFSTINLFQNCKMIVFGNFNKSDDNIGFVLDDFSKKNSHIPIVKSNQIGHSFVNKPIILQ